MTQACASCNLHCDIHAWVYHIEQRDKWTPSRWGVHPEVHYLQPVHTSTHITVRIAARISRPRSKPEPSLCTLSSAQMVSTRFIWQCPPSRAHSGLSDYCGIAKKKKSHVQAHAKHKSRTISESSSALAVATRRKG